MPLSRRRFHPFVLPSALPGSLLLLSVACSTPPSPEPPKDEGLERQVRVLTEQTRANDAQIRKLSQELQALQAALSSLDNQIWARQSALAKNLTEVRSDLLPSLTGQVESLSHQLKTVHEQLDDLQSTLTRDRTERTGNETFETFTRQGMAVQLERTQAQLAQLQAATAALAARLDQAQIEQQQAFSAEAAWLGALAGQLERYRLGLSGKRPAPRPPAQPAP